MNRIKEIRDTLRYNEILLQSFAKAGELREALNESLTDIATLLCVVDNWVDENAQLVAERDRLTAERDAALADMKEMHCMGRSCAFCSHHTNCERKVVEVGYCTLFKWRGMQEVQDGEA